MTKGNIEWNQSRQGNVTTTLTVNCNADGSIEMETPPSHGGYSGKFNNPQEAAENLSKLFEEGLSQARR